MFVVSFTRRTPGSCTAYRGKTLCDVQNWRLLALQFCYYRCLLSCHWLAFSLLLAVFMICTVIMERMLLCTSLHTCVCSCWASIWFTCQVCFMLFVSVAWGCVSWETRPIILHLVRFDQCVCDWNCILLHGRKLESTLPKKKQNHKKHKAF